MTVEVSVWYFVEVVLGCILCLKVGYDWGARKYSAALNEERRQNKRIARKNRELTENLQKMVKVVK